MATLTEARAWIDRPAGMTESETRTVLDLLLSGTLAPADGGALLARWGERGETGREVAAVVAGLLARATAVPVEQPCIDLCGTGGSGRSRFNVSTACAFLLAAAGAKVTKHGNRGSLTPNGSFDLLEALGVPFGHSPAALARLLAGTGVCFLFARAVHPAVAAAAPYRKAAGRRTVFNLAGPLANPCRPARQVIGAANDRTARVVADALGVLGVERALVVTGEPGIDEITVCGDTRWIEIRGASMREGVWRHPRWSVAYESLPGGVAEDNALTFAQLADGRATRPLAAMVLANADAALALWRDRAAFAGGPEEDELAALLAGGALRRAFEAHRAAARAALEPAGSALIARYLAGSAATWSFAAASARTSRDRP